MLTQKRSEIFTKEPIGKLRARTEIRSQIMDDVSKFSLGTFNYELEGAFREVQYVPIFPYFYKPQGFDQRSVNT